MADAQNTDQIPPEQRLQETLSRYEEQGFVRSNWD